MTAKLFKSQHKVIFCGNSATKQRRDELTAAGASIVLLPDDAVGKPDVNAGMQYLGTQGVNHALIEAGPGLVTSILAAGAVDVFIGPSLTIFLAQMRLLQLTIGSN